MCIFTTLIGCNVINMYVFLQWFYIWLLIGGLCATKCSGGQSCRQFGQYVCLCEKGKTGKDCEEKGTLSQFVRCYWVFVLL